MVLPVPPPIRSPSKSSPTPAQLPSPPPRPGSLPNNPSNSAPHSARFRQRPKSSSRMGRAPSAPPRSTTDSRFQLGSSAGVHNITAYYSGDVSFLPSTSARPQNYCRPRYYHRSDGPLHSGRHSPPSAQCSTSENSLPTPSSITNLAFLNSHIPVAIHLVHSQQIAYKESGNSTPTCVDCLLPTMAIWTPPTACANTYGADLVSLFESDGDLGGVSYELNDLRDKTNSDFAFSVVLAGQSAGPYYALAHELGHNLGGNPRCPTLRRKRGNLLLQRLAIPRQKWRALSRHHELRPRRDDPLLLQPSHQIPGRPQPAWPNYGRSARTITMTAPYVAAYRKTRRTSHS